MQLIGMPDSPFVRRVAITLHLLGIAHEHNKLSVFRTYDEFRAINPVVRVPTLVCDDGTQLMDSNLIVDYLEYYSGKALIPRDLPGRQRALRLIGLAMAACDKTSQLVIENKVRAPEERSSAWITRVKEQLGAALALLEAEVAAQPFGEELDQASITVAVTWRFTQFYFADEIRASDYPVLNVHSMWAEQQPAFLAVPPEA